MIEKFISIKNVARFRDCTPRGDVTFRKMTLLFAENGRGKTTLCAILRSLQSGQPEYIYERKTLGTTDPASIKIRLDGDNFTFGSCGWSATHPDIAIFDSVFVHDNVYAGDYVDHEQKKNLYRVIVGTQGVQLARQIEKLDGQIRSANTEIKTKKAAASKSLPNETTLEAYLAWKPLEDIENKMQKKSTEIVNRQRTIVKATEIQTKGVLGRIALPALPCDFEAVLSKRLADIAADAEARVRQQINAHQMGHQGETWLSQGLGFVADDKCPFCEQSIQANELIATYQSHFNTAYRELKQEVTQLSQQLNRAIGESSLIAVQQTLSSNLTLIEFWKQFAELAVPSFDFEDVRTRYTTLHELASALAQRKQQSPTEPVIPSVDFQTALDAVATLRKSVDSYNIAVDKANTLINEQKTAVQQGTDVSSLKKILVDLEAKKKRFEPVIVQACKEYQDTVDAKTALEQQKATAKDHLDRHCQQILLAYQSSINAYLDQFNAGFRITNTQHSYLGGTPSSHYQIEINNNAINLGDQKTQPGTPCFKTVLSSGDRSALALAFFLAAMKQDEGIENKIVVFDDPFASQDRFRRTCTQQLIRKLADTAMQVVVLSHDPHFLKLIWEGYPATNIKTLQMCRTGESTIIGEWDIEAETQSIYLKNYSTLLDFYRERKGPPFDVVQKIRPFVEGLYRVRYPGHFQQSEWLGDFIAKIRATSDTDGLSHAKTDLSEIEAINDYSKKYHHDQNPNADSEPLSEDELHGFVKRTLKLVGDC